MSDAGGSSGSSGFGGSSPAVDEDFDVIRIIIDVIYAIDDAFGWINRFWDEAASCSWYNRLVKISGVQEEREAILSRAIQWCEEIVPSLDILFVMSESESTDAGGSSGGHGRRLPRGGRRGRSGRYARGTPRSPAANNRKSLLMMCSKQE
ncbi:hypothetical protein Bhyg_04665, partial [Pseudolycoriella hygida]